MSPDEAYNAYRIQVRAIKRDWPGRITLMQQTNVSAYDVLALLDAYRGMEGCDCGVGIQGTR